MEIAALLFGLNDQQVTTRVEGDLYYVLSDHLGSTTVVADAQGQEMGYLLYSPYGEVYEDTLPPGLTDRLFSAKPPSAACGQARYMMLQSR